MAVTRASVMSLARTYAQVPTTVIGDTNAYLLQDEIELAMYGEAARRAPSLFMTTQTISYPANTSFIVPTIQPFRIVLLGTKADSGSRYTFFQPCGPLEFNELESSNQHANTGPPYKFHNNGTNLYLRPMPQQATDIFMYYTPACSIATTTTGNVFGGNVQMQVWANLLAMRLAVRLRMITGRDITSLATMVKPEDENWNQQIQLLQDAEPAHVAKTESFLTGGGGATYLDEDNF